MGDRPPAMLPPKWLTQHQGGGTIEIFELQDGGSSTAHGSPAGQKIKEVENNGSSVATGSHRT